MVNGNIFILGISISYFAVAIIQAIVPGTLSAALYVTVSFVSLELSILELIKICINSLIRNYRIRKQITAGNCAQLHRTIINIEKYKTLYDVASELRLELKESTHKHPELKKDRIYKRLEQVCPIISSVQIILCVLQIVITPLKLIPYDLLTTKVINVCSLMSLAIVFFSYYISSWSEDTIRTILSQQQTSENMASFYLTLIENINQAQEKE